MSSVPSLPHPALRREIIRNWQPSVYPIPTTTGEKIGMVAIGVTVVGLIVAMTVGAAVAIGTGLGWLVVAITS